LLVLATENKTLGGSVIVLLKFLKTKLDSALAGVLTSEKQANVDDIFAINKSDKDDLEAAILENTPQESPVE